MLTELTAPLNSGERRADARHRRREAAAPYVSTSKKVHDEDEDEQFFAGETVQGRRSSIFARLASYIPIVNKLVREDEEVEGTNDNDEVKTSQEDIDEKDDQEDKTLQDMKQPQVTEHSKEESPKKEQRRFPPVTPEPSSFVPSKEHLATPPRHNNKRGSRKSRSPSRESSADSNDRSPGSRQRKKRVFLPGPSHQSKLLHISNSQRRRKSPSPSPHDSALAVIKQKKTISLEEFERLQHQLRDMVETTPQTQLAMTQAALANGLERPFTRGFPGPISFPGYVPGSFASHNHGALVVHDDKTRGSELATKSGAPFGKRVRTHDNTPILFSGSALHRQLTREERLMRKPRPSRLLTGAKRDAAARKAYSAAVAEKILSTLNKVQDTLEKEAPKPTPSTSMSWVKHHHSLVEGENKSSENGMDVDTEDIVPPISTIPRVTFSQHKQKPTASTPEKSMISHSTPLFSPQSVTMTPKAATKTASPTFKIMGEFKFTLPPRSERVDEVEWNNDDSRIQFEFSPPPSMREPPLTASQSSLSKINGVSRFDFMPSSPKSKMSEWISKPLKGKELEQSKADEVKPQAVMKKSVPEVSKSSEKDAGSASSGVNPLARFLQLKPGQWKCPGCSVLNESSSAKCPCCETKKPGGEPVKKTAVTPKVDDAISSQSKDAKSGGDQPATGSITTSGFVFGIPAAESKKTTEETAKPSSGGFSFDLGKKSDVPVAAISSSGFSFTAPTPAPPDNNAFSGGFSFGVPSTSEVKSISSPSAAPVSFGFSAPTMKTTDTKSPAATEKRATSSFTAGLTTSIGISSGFTTNGTNTNESKKTSSEPKVLESTSAPLFNFSSAATSTTVSEVPSNRFSLGDTKNMPHETNKSEKSATSTFTFGATTTTAPSRSAQPTFNVGSKTKSDLMSRSLKESDRPKKRLAPSSLGSKTDVPTPQVLAKDITSATSLTPAFGGSINATTTNNQKDTSAGFSFGVAPTPEKKAAEGPKETSTAPLVGQATTESKAPIFTFGSAGSTLQVKAVEKSSDVAASKPVTSAPSFTFGQSSTTNSTPGFGSHSATPSAPAFGVVAATSSANYGKSTPPLPGKSTPTGPMQSTPGFSFGSSSTTQPAFGFGSGLSTTPATTSSFTSASNSFGSSNSGTFGSNSNFGSFGSAAHPTPAAPAFSIGASSQTPNHSAAKQPEFSFGSSSAPTAGFGSTATGFGSSAPSGGFGASPVPGGFRSSSPAPGFGNQSAPTASAFGSSLPPPTTFGGPSGGFGNSTPSSDFRAPSPTPAFGAAPGAPAFGAAPGAPSFGSGPGTTSSAPAFGAQSAPSTFGAPSAAPAFGAPAATPAFGAPSSTPAFGAPATGAFGAPTSGGFNMGAAPQHIKGRRILKAKPRSRRTS